MRAVAEVVAAAALLAVSLIVAAMVWQLYLPHAKLLEPPKARLLVAVNSTHALCVALEPIEVKELKDAGLRVWVFKDVDGDGWLEPVAATTNTVIRSSELYLVSPPICTP